MQRFDATSLLVRAIVLASLVAIIVPRAGAGAFGTMPDHAVADGTESDRPNLVVILADDAGAECFGTYGGESHATPHLDALAAEGLRFDNAFTQPLCTPTRLELLTGRSNARNYKAFSVLDPGERTFAEVLGSAGYRTGAVGKWQLLAAEHYPDGIRGSGSTPAEAGFERHALWQVEALGRRHWGPTLTIDGITQTWPDDAYGPDVVLDAALSWIDAWTEREATAAEVGSARPSRREPFLLFWPMILPHAPFIAPPGTEGPRRGRGDVAHFGSMVEHLDRQVGRLIAFLRDRDLEDETVVLFIGDNGSPRAVRSIRHGATVPGGKGLPTDAGSRVPFIAWAPGRIAPGRVVTAPVSTVDVFATVLEAAGVPLPMDRPLDGVSLWPCLLGRAAPTREAVAFHHHPRPRTRPASTALRWARDETWQLFDDGRLYEIAVDPALERPIAKVDDDAEAARARVRLELVLTALPYPVRHEDGADDDGDP